MSFTLELTEEQQALREKTHEFARDVIRPAAAEYDRAQELPWPILQEAARQGLYQWELYAELATDPTGLSLPILMEELFWGCAGIGLTIVLPALALAAIRQAATDEQLAQWAPQCFGTPGEIKLAALAVTEPSGGSDVRSIQTRARKDGDDWVIEGQKVFIGNGGIARAALEFARDYAVSREAFGQAIIENQGVAFPLADLAADIDAARLLTWRAAWMAAQRVPFERAEGSMSKLKASEVCVRACEQAVQTLGGWGYIRDFPVEKWYRDAKLFTIFEGTSEIQRLVIGRALRAAASTEPLDQRMLEPR